MFSFLILREKRLPPQKKKKKKKIIFFLFEKICNFYFNVSREFNNGRTIRSQHLIGKEEALVSLDLPCLLFRHQGQSAPRRPCSRAKSTRLLFTLPITTPPLFLSPRPDFVSCLTPLVAKDAHGYRKSPEDTI